MTPRVLIGCESSGVMRRAFAARGCYPDLNPEHSRWLMGYPAAWGSCAVTAMPSSRKRRPSS